MVIVLRSQFVRNKNFEGFTLWDSPICSILPYLGAASDFIERALKAEGRVMVCCQMGVSRFVA